MKKQIFEYMFKKKKPDILLMDRNLFSTVIFMKVMGEEGFYPEEHQKWTSKNYKYWNWLIKEALVIWWKTPVEETIKRLTIRNRTGEDGLEYYRKLDKNYRKYMLEVYSNIKVITKETLLSKEQI